MGHLIRIANQIAGNTRALGLEMLDRTREELTANVEEGQLQSELDEDTFQRWSEFITGPVAEMNKKNDTNLVSTTFLFYHVIGLLFVLCRVALAL